MSAFPPVAFAGRAFASAFVGLGALKLACPNSLAKPIRLALARRPPRTAGSGQAKRMPLLRFPRLFSAYGIGRAIRCCRHPDDPASALEARFRSAAGGIGRWERLRPMRFFATPSREFTVNSRNRRRRNRRGSFMAAVLSAHVPLPSAAILPSLVDQPAHPCRACLASTASAIDCAPEVCRPFAVLLRLAG